FAGLRAMARGSMGGPGYSDSRCDPTASRAIRNSTSGRNRGCPSAASPGCRAAHAREAGATQPAVGAAGRSKDSRVEGAWTLAFRPFDPYLVSVGVIFVSSLNAAIAGCTTGPI